MTVVDMFGTLKQYKDSGNMTEAQSDPMRDLDEDTQVRMVQGILKAFGYTPAKAAEVYGVSEAEIVALLVRVSFNSTLAEMREDETLATLLPARPRPDPSLPVFSRYEPVSPTLGPQFDRLPNIN